MEESKKNDIIENTIKYLSKFFINTRQFIYEDTFRYGIVILMVYLNIVNYKNNKQRYSKKDCFNLYFFKIKCSDFYYYLALVLLIINTLFLYYLQKILPPKKLPNNWWGFIVILAFLIIVSIKGSSELVEEDGTLNPPPKIKRYNKRSIREY